MCCYLICNAGTSSIGLICCTREICLCPYSDIQINVMFPVPTAMQEQDTGANFRKPEAF